jgi:thiamine biosynthesis lipoprotein
VIKLWGFGGGAQKKIPAEAEIEEKRKIVGFQYIKWNEDQNTVWKLKDGVQLDVNAFAPGWAADLIGKLLEEEGVEDYMVDISGEILFKGQKSPDAQWVAGIEKPSKEYAQGIQLAFKIKNRALATSGNYRQFYDENNKRFSHIIDPRTGHPVTHSIASASVITENAASADAWSTALMVLGSEGLAIAEKHGIKVLILEAKSPGTFEEIVSPSMKSYIEENRL